MSPIVLFAPGLGGFRQVLWIRYFRRLPKLLKRLGVEAHFHAPPLTARLEDRARSLGRALEGHPGREVLVIAHSMGGLDARCAIQRHDPEHRIRTLVTLATPHRGSPLARWKLQERDPVSWLVRSMLRRPVDDLTPEACERFNRDVPDRPDVRYLSYAAVRPPEEMPFLVRPWTRRMLAAAGDNDCLVPVESAQWGEFRGVLRADHFELVGWSGRRRDPGTERPFDHLAFYEGLIRELATD